MTDGRHSVRITRFTDDNCIVRKYPTKAAKLEILDCQDQRVAEFETIYCRDLYSCVKHSNGRTYLVFSIDLYGYSVLDLSDYSYVHYVPESSFSKGQETFIWCKVFYNPRSNLIAVDGCYWGGLWKTEFFDFSRPMEPPFKKLCSTDDMQDQFNMGYDIIPVGWNDDGTITLENETEHGIIKKDIKILAYTASP